MKYFLSFILLTFIFTSCTSNTILEKPKDLIPKDSMSLLIQEMMIATSAKAFKNKNLQKKINYMPFVYDKYKIDSTRFQNSNLYYMSIIDDYIKIFEDANSELETKVNFYKLKKKKEDSLKIDSLKSLKIKKKNTDSILPEKKLFRTDPKKNFKRSLE